MLSGAKHLLMVDDLGKLKEDTSLRSVRQEELMHSLEF